MLKVAYDDDARRREPVALRALRGPVVRLLEQRPEGLVLERLEPGRPLADTGADDETVTRLLGTTMRQLWAPVPPGCPLPTAEQECAPLHDPAATAPLPAGLVEAARTALARLLAGSPPPVVLHGDLHDDNLLSSDDGRGWVAIDPHGVVGDPAYDVGPVLLNPLDGEPARLVRPRLDQLARLLDLPRSRLAAWGVVRCVLSEAWEVQDSGRPDGGPLRVAEALVSA